MKIQRIETFCNQFVGFVRVQTDDGAEGWTITPGRKTSSARPW